MNNNSVLDAFYGVKHVGIIGVKGMPPEFAGTSGVEFYVAERLLALHRMRIDTACYVRSWATPGHKRSYKGTMLIHVPSVPSKHLDALTHSLCSTIHACFSPTDAVWYQASGPALFSFLPRFFGKKVFVTIHTLEWKRKKWGWLAKAILLCSEWTAIRCAHAVLTVSQELAHYCKRKYHISAIIDTPITTPVARKKPGIIRQKYGLRENTYILYLGRFVPEKRIDWLIQAFQGLPHTNLRLVLAGGAHHTNPYEETLRVLVKNDTRVVFAGWVFGKEKEELLTNCKLFVLPSSLEGNPTVLYELPRDKDALVSDDVANTVSYRKRLHTFPAADKKEFIKQLHECV